MSNRRQFIGTSLTVIAGLTLLPAINSFANPGNQYKSGAIAKPKLRFAIASDIH